MKQKILDLIKSLHAFQKLDDRVLRVISNVFKVDAFEICKENGITYDIGYIDPASNDVLI